MKLLSNKVSETSNRSKHSEQVSNFAHITTPTTVKKKRDKLNTFHEYRKEVKKEEVKEEKQERIDNSKTITAPVLPKSLQEKIKRRKVVKNNNEEANVE